MRRPWPSGGLSQQKKISKVINAVIPVSIMGFETSKTALFEILSGGKVSTELIGLCSSRNKKTFMPLVLYRVIHKSLRDFRTRLRNNQDRHGRKEHINRYRISPSFFFVLGGLAYFKVPPLVKKNGVHNE